MDSHVCVLIVLGGMCGLPFTGMWCLEGCVNCHGCVLRVLGVMCR